MLPLHFINIPFDSPVYNMSVDGNVSIGCKGDGVPITIQGWAEIAFIQSDATWRMYAHAW